MYTAGQLRTKIIQPTLKHFEDNRLSMENLLFGTCAHESKKGRYLTQLGGGPALGIYQMEPNTYDDIWNNYLAYRPQLTKKILSINSNSLLNLTRDPIFATAMAFLQYKRAPTPLPEASDIVSLAAYWKKYYNTQQGKGTVAQWTEDYYNAEKE